MVQNIFEYFDEDYLLIMFSFFLKIPIDFYAGM